jgi:hypothetical protein
MYKAFIEPDLQLAQLKIQNSFNPFTGFMNATYILKARRPADLVPNAVMDAVGVSGAEGSRATGAHLVIPCIACAPYQLVVTNNSDKQGVITQDCSAKDCRTYQPLQCAPKLRSDRPGLLIASPATCC